MASYNCCGSVTGTGKPVPSPVTMGVLEKCVLGRALRSQRVGSAARLLRVLVALEKEPSSIPSIHMAAHNHL